MKPRPAIASRSALRWLGGHPPDLEEIRQALGAMAPCSRSWRMPGWSSKLTRPVAIKGGPVLRTLNDARAFVIDRLPEEDQDRVSWQRTAELLLAAAEGSAEIETATQQLERALFLQAKWLLPED
jgi:hypothetical protein